jgi:hypothetical protein
VPGGTELRGTTEVVVRDGVAGVADRAQLWMLDRAYRTAMGQLPEAAAGHTETRSHPGGERSSP